MLLPSSAAIARPDIANANTRRQVILRTVIYPPPQGVVTLRLRSHAGQASKTLRGCPFGLEWNSSQILLEPCPKCLQAGIDASRERETSRRAQVVAEIAKELEHIAQVLGSGKTKRSVDLRWDVVVTDFFANGLAQGCRGLMTSQMLSRYANSFADIFRPALEYSVAALSYIFSRYRWHFGIRYRQRKRQF